MDLKYGCPHCSAKLNPGAMIILLGRREALNVLFAFHPEPGNYEVGIPEGVTIEPGEVWNFSCPVCQGDLAFEGEENLAALNMTDGVGNEYKVVFSRIAGEHATFVIARGEEVEVEAYGANLSRYDRSLFNNYI